MLGRYLYGGDVTRKMKLEAKQKAGGKRAKERSIGRVSPRGLAGWLLASDGRELTLLLT